MKFEIKKQIKNPLFNREEFDIEITADNNPKKEDIISFLKKDSEVCVVKEIQGNFGRDLFESIVFVYDSVEAKEKTEYIPRKMKKKIEEEKKKAEEAKKKAEEEAKQKEAEASKEEAVSEEVKEEPKTEENKTEEVKDGN